MKIKRLLTCGLVSLCSFFALASCEEKTFRLNEEEHNSLKEILSNEKDRLKNYKSVTNEYTYTEIGEKPDLIGCESKSKSVYDFESGNLSYAANFKRYDNSTGNEIFTLDFKLDTFKKDDGYILVFDLFLWNYPVRELVVDESGFAHYAYGKYASGTVKGYSSCSKDFNISDFSFLFYSLADYDSYYWGTTEAEEGIGVYANKDRSYIYDCGYKRADKSQKAYHTARNGLVNSWGWEIKYLYDDKVLQSNNINSKYEYSDKIQLGREISTANLTYYENIVDALDMTNTKLFLGAEGYGDWARNSVVGGVTISSDFLKTYFLVEDMS